VREVSTNVQISLPWTRFVARDQFLRRNAYGQRLERLLAAARSPAGGRGRLGQSDDVQEQPT